MKKLALVLLLGLMAQTASAQTFWSCQTKNGKHLSLSKIGSYYEYQFGKIGKPELSFRNKIIDVMSREETFYAIGTGYFNLQVEMVNGNHTYIINRSEERGTGAMEAGVDVFRNGKKLVSVMCNPNKIYENDYIYSEFQKYGKFY